MTVGKFEKREKQRKISMAERGRGENFGSEVGARAEDLETSAFK